ncbi:hypothetical protein AKJ57_04440 [candidate division MSBL1 archaeon SCGC-AAA259A05]|uniref:Nucleoside phosphorylase domain-containing protein n=1 Tax=candidate division MSBL1 archaeon SCGC-AAA259A05 TaxID=1698259 RepID=A0A133U7I6_9EURY|nr:hypothetical protein AKJ57_04440 [candidate division MSBL1 archaeon SCGC-AAA259A05]
MGKLSETYFGTDEVPQCIVLGGYQEAPFREVFGDLKTEFSCESSCFSGYLFSDPPLSVIKNVYGAPSAYEAVKTLKDGNCRAMTFVGYAQSRVGHEIGEVIVPTRIKGLDSISNEGELKPEVSKESLMVQPDEFGGRHLSKQAVTYESQEVDREIESFEPHSIDLELATIVKASNNLGIDCQFYLIISDRAFEDLFDEKKKNRKIESMIELLTKIKSRFAS